MLPKAKSVKLRALRSPRKFGVAGRSCQEVLRKGCLRFQRPETGSLHRLWLCLYEDGTELTEDYFPSIPDNAELTWQGCKWQGPWGGGKLATWAGLGGLTQVPVRKGGAPLLSPPVSRLRPSGVRGQGQGQSVVRVT
uniref:DNA fragmentation factor subunit beta n=1 Tax=Microcebus murinus TaxID=30608 RepID=A0A8C5XG08_MICMU